MVLVLYAETDMEHTALIWYLLNNGVSIWAAYIHVWAAIINMRTAYTPRMLGTVGVCIAHLPTPTV